MSDLAWHFTGARLRDGRPLPAIGETLVHKGPVVWCKSGLYAARTAWQAFYYCPDADPAAPIWLHRVHVGRIVREEPGDKLVCRERTILASREMTFTFRRFAADQALGVAHLWDMPTVVRDYLTTLDDAKGAAAREAVWASAEAAWAAAAAAAAAASRAASRAAAREASREASREAAWEAAREAAREAVWASAEAARAAVGASRMAAENDFNARVEALFREPA